MAVDPYSNETRLERMSRTTRRQFLLIMGAVGGGIIAIFGGIKSLQFLFPGATLEEPLGFKVAADPATITIGNPLQITEKRVSIVRDDGGFYAVYLICTHLGCTPNYTTNVSTNTGDDAANTVRANQRGERTPPQQQPNGWACPCHGSRYFIDSTNFFGPAPRPMDWVDISFTPDGSLFVDRGVKVVFRGAGVQTPPLWRLDPVTKQNNGKTMGV